MMNEEQRKLRARTTQYALRIVRLYRLLWKNDVGQILGRQLLRSGTSVGAHYREAGRARSVAEFISKIEGGLQELDETAYWLELLVAAHVLPSSQLGELVNETEELLSIMVASARTAKSRQK